MSREIIKEVTQTMIAISVVLVTLYSDSHVALSNVVITEKQTTGLVELNIMAALVTGFYFGRHK